MASKFADKSIVITGGSKGIGLGLVQKFLNCPGSHVVATTRKPVDALELSALQQQFKDRLQVNELDTSNAASIKKFAMDLKLGGLKHVDVLVNNAGMYGRRLGLPELEPEDFMVAFQTNAVGPFLVVQQLLAAGLIGSPTAESQDLSAQRQQQQQQGEGGCSTLIANISSIVASHGDQAISSQMSGGYAYRASKAALNIINKALCNDLNASHRVESVLLHPGYVRTDLTSGLGAIDVKESTDGLFAVLSSGKPLNNRFYSYTGDEIPW